MQETSLNTLKIQSKTRNLLHYNPLTIITIEGEKRKIKTDNFSLCQSTSHSSGIKKGSQYGEYLFEQRQQLVAENQSNTIQVESEKVTNMVGAFLNEDTINAIKLVSEKTKKIIEEIPGI